MNEVKEIKVSRIKRWYRDHQDGVFNAALLGTGMVFLSGCFVAYKQYLQTDAANREENRQDFLKTVQQAIDDGKITIKEVAA